MTCVLYRTGCNGAFFRPVKKITHHLWNSYNNLLSYLCGKNNISGSVYVDINEKGLKLHSEQHFILRCNCCSRKKFHMAWKKWVLIWAQAEHVIFAKLKQHILLQIKSCYLTHTQPLSPNSASVFHSSAFSQAREVTQDSFQVMWPITLQRLSRHTPQTNLAHKWKWHKVKLLPLGASPGRG